MLSLLLLTVIGQNCVYLGYLEVRKHGSMARVAVLDWAGYSAWWRCAAQWQKGIAATESFSWNNLSLLNSLPWLKRFMTCCLIPDLWFQFYQELLYHYRSALGCVQIISAKVLLTLTPIPTWCKLTPARPRSWTTDPWRIFLGLPHPHNVFPGTSSPETPSVPGPGPRGRAAAVRGAERPRPGGRQGKFPKTFPGSRHGASQTDLPCRSGFSLWEGGRFVAAPVPSKADREWVRRQLLVVATQNS